MEARTNKLPPLPALTGSRIILAVWVVALHLTTENAAVHRFVYRLLPSALVQIVESGASAVGIFFLLSGFVLAYSYDLGKAWPKDRLRGFLTARVARIYPVYLLALVLGVPSLIAGTVKSGPFHPVGFFFAAVAALFLIQAWIPTDALFWAGPGWSLSAEAFFYVCFPFTGRLLWPINRRTGMIGMLIGLWLLICAVSYWVARLKAPWFMHGRGPDDGWSAFIKFDPLLRLPEFLAGIVLCRLYLSLALKPWGRLGKGNGHLLYLPGIILVLLVTANSAKIAVPLLHDGLMLPATAMILLGLALGGGTLERWLSGRRMVLLGQASYATYILHMPLLSYIAAAGKRLPGGALWMQVIVYLPLLAVVSIVVFLRVENPSRQMVLKWFAGPRAISASEPISPVAADPF